MTVFAGVVGHDRVTALLEREVTTPAHAYLLIGAAGVGKATIARRFAAALLCPVGALHEIPCSSCRRVAEGHHPDLVLVEPEGRQSLGVDQARATVAQAVLMPVESLRRVFLFEEAGAMTDQAANALLKTLEEPTRSPIFILAAESEDELPATVASRCRTIQLGRVDDLTVATALLGAGATPEQAEGAARVAGGRPGLAFTLASRPEVAEFRNQWLSMPLRLSPRPGDAFLLAEEMLGTVEPLLQGMRDRHAREAEAGRSTKERQDRELRRAAQALLATGLEILASWYTDAASAQHGGPVRNRDVPLAALTSVPAVKAVGGAELVLDAIVDLEANLRPQLVLANLLTVLAGEE